MKNVLIGLLYITLIIFPGCDADILDIKAPIPTEDTYFTSEEQLDGGIIGIYSKLVFFYNYRGYSGNGYLHDVRLMPDDDITTNNQTAYEVFDLVTPQDAKLSDYFGYLYELNFRANSFLDIQAEKLDVYANSDLADYHRGEALFLRGYSHYVLWNMFGVAPVILERTVSETQFYPANSEGTQLLDAAIEDFKEAATLLPPSWGAIDAKKVGRATRGSALGMAGKALIFRGTVNQNTADLLEAKTLLDQITGYALMNNYYDNFDINHENNMESLFEIQLGPNTNTPELSNPWLSTDNFAGNGDISNYLGFFDGHWSASTGRMLATQSLLDEFDPDDPRFEASMKDNGEILKYVVDDTPGKGENQSFEVSYHNNARILRWAEVLLLKAEALVQSGGSLSEAIGYINEVRARAKPGDAAFLRDVSETDRVQVMEWIIDERRFELAFEEGIRWWDLRRWHFGGVLQDVYGTDLLNWDFSSIHETKANGGPFDFEEKNLFYPIPFGELQLNPNLAQHPLWQSE